MLLSVIVSVYPASVFADGAAAQSVTVNPSNMTKSEDEIVKMLESYKQTDKTPEVLLAEEAAAGFLDSIETAEYSLYVNRYTGLAYYKNNVTGQILTSNPTDPGTNKNLTYEVLSQVKLEYTTHAKPQIDNPFIETSYECITNGNLLSTSKYVYDDGTEGIKIDYMLGEAESVNLVPGAMLESDAFEYVFKPVFDNFAALFGDAEFPADGISYKILGVKNKTFTLHSFNLGDEANRDSIENYGALYSDYINQAVSQLQSYATTLRSDGVLTRAEESAIRSFASNIKIILNEYNLYNVNVPNLTEEKKALWYEYIPAMEESGEAAFAVDPTLATEDLEKKYRLLGKAFKACIGNDITSDIADQIEENSGYQPAIESFPSFTCSIIYSLDSAGHLVVDFPASLIDYDESTFILKSITPLQYFGCADMSTGGYIFLPDGSGTVIDFEDFYSHLNPVSVQVSSEIYGKDYCYATITGKHKEQITMPVYGVVNNVAASDDIKAAIGSDTVVNGYFAILEEGSSLAKLGATSGGGTHKYATANASYTPYSYDEYDLSATTSVGGAQSYLIVSEDKYDGSYKTRYTMLTDPALASAKLISSYYPTTYVGMAACYRDYLKANGTLTKIETAATDIPLYIEALGSMDVTQKILTFPVSVSTPLTSFEDVKKMYDEFSDAKAKLVAKAEEQTALGNALKDSNDGNDQKQAEIYFAKAAEYQRLANEIQNITNLNFKLTGFANGGMYFTYPAKVRWDNSIGGSAGFEDLVSTANGVNATQNPNEVFNLFPDFDFQYINNTAIFDGVNNGSHAAKLVDNRYASKQVYDSVSGLYETLFSTLVSSSVLDELYTKFNNDYSKFGYKNLSVSTLGSDLNSNFDDENPVSREKARQDVVALLDRMVENGYTLMTDVGNIYSVEFVDHIVNAAIDSSHRVFSSYAVPFLGMVLHSYVSYAGTPLNYTGSVDYNILRSIENGASLYYILCTQNTSYLKEDEILSEYYGVDYENWFDKIVVHYTNLNSALGTLQNYEIVDHSAIIGERILDSKETYENRMELINELIANIDSAINAKINEKRAEIGADPANIGKGVKLDIDLAAIKEYAKDRFALTAEEIDSLGYDALIAGVVSKYSSVGEFSVAFGAADISYESEYDYVTESTANSKNYDSTDFTIDNGNIVMVRYSDGVKSTVFFINYNNFDVEIIVDSSIDKSMTAGTTKTIEVGRCGYAKIEY